MGQFVLLVLVLLGALITVPLGERLGLPAPVLMTLLGILLAVLPFVPNVDVPPGIVLPLLLPPLLYAAARRTSWREFAANWRPIFLLAVALVFVTTAAVAAVAHALVPGCRRPPPWRSAPWSRRPTRSRPRPWPGGSGCRGAWCRCWRARGCSTT
ncbi:cation:proton antiporter domain-containing protein [Actinomadura luzonensis]|uniref:cation:proton antiporter domain-containing protein n=1 Tax=Actinomadura luzonensis TaxID=2805427 RepID=UPI002E1DE5E7